MRDNSAIRWTALILLALTMFFAYMFVDILSPIKSMVNEELGWSNTAFGIYGASEFAVNVFLFFLIFAGIILDKAGIRFTALLSGGLMVLGAGVKFYALSSYFKGTGLETFLNSWWVDFPGTAKLASLGFMIFGCGCEMGGITVSKSIVKWFKGKEMALAMGTEMAIARIGVAIAMVSSPIIAEKFGSVKAPVLLCLILLIIGLFSFIVYVFMDKRLDNQLAGEDSYEPEDPFHFSDLSKLFRNRSFLIVAALCVLYYSAIFPFQKYAVNMLECNLNMSAKTAGLIFFWFPIGAAAITPFLGSYLDFKGKGASMLIFGAVLMFLCHITFALVPLTPFIAITAIIVLGISFSLVPAALWPSVPKLVDQSYLGSAYAVIFWIQNIGLMVFPIIIGRVLDITNGPNVDPTELNYTPAMLIFSCLGIAAFFLGLWLKAEDKRKKYGLELPNKVS